MMNMMTVKMAVMSLIDSSVALAMGRGVVGVRGVRVYDALQPGSPAPCTSNTWTK